MIRKLFVIFFFILSLQSFGQYDAHKLINLYKHSGKSIILLDQLFTEKAFNAYFPFNEKVRIYMEQTKKDFYDSKDSLLINLPDETQLKKLTLRINEKLEIWNMYFEKNKLNEKDWKKFYKIHLSLISDLEKLQEIVLSFLIPQQDVINILNNLKSTNKFASRAFLSGAMKNMFPQAPIGIYDEPEEIKSASKKISKLDKYFENEPQTLKWISRLKSDLNTFYMGFNNNYDLQLLVSTYIKFNSKILKLHDHVFKTKKFI